MPCAVILTALAVEYSAVRAHLSDLREEVHANGTVYDRGRFGAWDVCLVQIEVGNVEAERATAYFNPSVVLSVGVAGGIKDVRLGDVVAATKVYGYESGEAEEVSRHGPEIGVTDYRLEQRARAEARKNDWLQRIPATELAPRVMVGPIVAASTASELYMFMPSNYPNAVAVTVEVEMEIFGFLAAVRANQQVATMVIRGISDLIDGKERADRDSLQKVAARNASAFAFEVLAKFQPQARANDVSTVEWTTAQELFIAKIAIKNIKCFPDLTLDVRQGELDKWVMILGDNAIGKSTLLKAIALGLCQESDAAALTKIRGESNDFIRNGAQEGSITIELQRGKLSENAKNKYTITTKISRDANGTSEIVRKETTQPAHETTPFPWKDIFVCAYGAYRAQRADDSHERYSFLDAVRSLFDRQASLQNPELILLRQTPGIRHLLQTKLLQILMLDLVGPRLSEQQQGEVDLTPTGLDISGPWGTINFSQLSDGYRSTTLWVLDFLSWVTYAQRLSPTSEIGGILILDELEQHLHPLWQRSIVECIRRQFPQTQVISSTHTPLVAAGIADIEGGCLVKLERSPDQTIHLVSIPKEMVAGQRADQILTSAAFDLITTRNQKSYGDIDRYTHLLSKSQRTAAEEKEVTALRAKIQRRFTDGETPTARVVKQAMDEALEKLVTEIDPTSLDMETRKQLQELLQLAAPDHA